MGFSIYVTHFFSFFIQKIEGEFFFIVGLQRNDFLLLVVIDPDNIWLNLIVLNNNSSISSSNIVFTQVVAIV